MNPWRNKAQGEAEAPARSASAECGNPAVFPGKSGWPKYRSLEVVPCYFWPLICCHEFWPFLQTVTAGSFYSSFSFLPPPPSPGFTDLCANHEAGMLPSVAGDLRTCFWSRGRIQWSLLQVTPGSGRQGAAAAHVAMGLDPVSNPHLTVTTCAQPH